MSQALKDFFDEVESEHGPLWQRSFDREPWINLNISQETIMKMWNAYCDSFVGHPNPKMGPKQL